MNLLLLCASMARHTGTVDVHIRAFKDYSRHNVVTLDSEDAGKTGVDVSLFDAIIFHYSIVISHPRHLSEELAQKIASFEGPKVLFIQDEFRWVDRTSKAAEKLGISVIFTVVNKGVIRKIYRNDYFDNVRFEQTLTGFVAEDLLTRQVPEFNDRPIDIGYRARKLPGWCGSFALQKWQIGEEILKKANKYGLNCDISMSENSRIYGEDWIDFMSSCKATLGTESGASFVDYTGLVYQEIDRYEAANPNASFEEVREKFLEGRDNEVIIHVISPRVFEAAALRVLMILYPGTYSGVIIPGRHYVELRRDHSNIDEVIGVLRNPEKAGEIIKNAYEEVACSPAWTHKSFIEHFDSVVDEEMLKYAGASGAQQINSVEMDPDEVEKKMAAKLAEFERMAAASASALVKAQKRMRTLLFLKKIWGASRELIIKYLPEFISRPLLSLAQKIINITKRVLKKFIFNV